MANEESAGISQDTAAQGQKQIGVSRIYLKDSSFESPHTPAVFAKEWKPHVNLNISAGNTKVDTDTYEVVLTVTAEAKIEDQNAFLCEVQQAGIFLLKGLTEEELKPVLGSFCPNQLFPYAREAISDLVGKGGFPQLMLQPINFDALLEHHRRELAKASQEAAQADDKH